jgi:hypothetical protein
VIANYNPANGLIEMGKGVATPTDPTLLSLGDVNGKRIRYLYNWDNNNFAPRVGFSWQPYHKETTVLKGGYGVFYNGPIQFNQYMSASTQVPIRTQATFTAAAAPPGTVSIAIDSPFTGRGGYYTAFGAEQRQPTPYVQMWSLGVQQEVSQTMVAEINYIGSKGTKLPFQPNINVIPLSVPLALRNQATRPDPKFGNITMAYDGNSSMYESLQTSLRKNLRNGTSFLLAYTWAKSIDYNGGTGSGSNSSLSTPQDPRNMAAEKGLSDFNVAQRVIFSPVFELPFGKNKPYLNHGLGAAIFGGFELSGIIGYQTGRPFTVYSSNSNRSLTYGASDRPNLVGDPNNGPKTPAKWFNTAAFVDPAKGFFGNEKRNVVIGPDNTQVDITIARVVNFSDRLAAQFRLETFNLPNHPNFYNPFAAAAQTGTTSFGQITNAYDPRQMQAAVRIIF